MRFITGTLLLLVSVATLGYAQTIPTFQHIIVIVQENRTPDNLFGSNITFEPGVDLQQPASGQWCLGACFDPGHLHPDWENEYKLPWTSCPGRGNAQPCTAEATYCNGTQVGPNMGELPVPVCPQQTYVSATYDGNVVFPYFDIATKYGFANYFFQTNQGPSMPAHQFLFSGTSAPSGVVGQGYWNYFEAENPHGGAGCTAPAGATVKLIDKSGGENISVHPCFSHNSLPTLLDPNHISWKYYANASPGWDIWNAPNAIAEICLPTTSSGECMGPDYINNDVLNPSQVLHDLGVVSPQECGLRNVSWVIPNGDRSDHPGLLTGKQNKSTDIEGGPAWVADIINAVGNSPCKNVDNSNYWNTTAIFVVWDDWGGFWDHIQPYEVLIDDPAHGKHCDPTTTFGCGYVSGFRVPLLVVSAYTPAGYVSGDTRTQGEQPKYTHDFGSILAFIENNFNLGIGNINAQNNYKFADAFAPDLANGTNIPLSDFFSIPQNHPRQFQAITLPTGAPDANYFINYNGPIEDPDNDVIDND